MTYGWSILIIAIVLAALFQLGVFSSTNFAPKAQPGSCQVFRPNGPGTTSFINTEGVCNGELPQYVAQLSSGNITYSLLPTDFLPSYTINFWIYPTSAPDSLIESYTSISGKAPGCDFYNIVILSNRALQISSWNLNYAGNWYTSDPAITVPLNTWSMITVSLVGGGVGTGNIIAYLNGNAAPQVAAEEVVSEPLAADHGSILSVSGGNCPGTVGGGGIQGNMANFQSYNTSLSSAEITALYNEGIGDAPIDLQNLAAWWPLNGNAQDYSGNNNDGTATNVIYTSSWTSGYSAP